MNQHPDFPQEAARVRQTAERARSQYGEAVEREAKQRQYTEDLRVAVGGDFNNDLFVAEVILAAQSQRVHNLRQAQEKPYFSHIDFRDGQGSHSYYIGKWGLTDPVTQKPYVVDWRSPLADLYYSGQVGPCGYNTPGGRVEGEMTLKRILTCQNGELVRLMEANIISEDDYLVEVLSDHANDRLRDIVTTIQAEQNVILRADRKRPVIVQGVAGAGKTTVALHRITWLLYTYQDTMTPKNLMVLAPNPLFLNYISAVLPELGVEDVLQVTFHGLAEKLCGRELFPLDDAATLLRLIDPSVPEEERARQARVANFKGSLDYKRVVEAYIEAMTENILPEGDVMLSAVRLYTAEDLRHVFARELAPFPLEKRRGELRKHMNERLKLGRRKLETMLDKQIESRTNLLRELMPENTKARQERMARIYAARDQRREEIDRLCRGYLDRWFRQWGKLDLLKAYRGLLQEEPSFSLPEGVEPQLWREVCQVTAENLERQRLDSGDIPALLLLQKALFGYAVRLDIHHTVIDEAQDLSAFAYDMLMELCSNASFTIVGDLGQGIHSYRGVQDWHALMAQVFPKVECSYYELVTSYRNTGQIMSFASKVLRRYPTPGGVLPKPVLRMGSNPRCLALEEGESLAQAVAGEIRRLEELGCSTVAVVMKLPRACRDLHWELWEKLDRPVRLLDDQDTEYTGGVMVLPAHLTKGLEFDAVIVADADAETWRDDALHARLLYVCLTRPLHHLTLFHRGPLTALLAGEKPEGAQVAKNDAK